MLIRRLSTLILGVVLLALVTPALCTEIPHVSTCNFCHTCHLGDTPPRTSMRQILGEDGSAHVAQHISATHSDGHSQSALSHGAAARSLQAKFGVKHLESEMFLATQGDTVPKQTQSNCTECYGCTTELTHMSSEAKVFNITYVHEKGATSSWLFRATTDKMPGGQAVVKVYCLPIAKRAGGKVPTCSPVTVQRNMMLYQALELLSEECGFTDILPQVSKAAGTMVQACSKHWWGVGANRNTTLTASLNSLFMG